MSAKRPQEVFVKHVLACVSFIIQLHPVSRSCKRCGSNISFKFPPFIELSIVKLTLVFLILQFYADILHH
jgi:hypothetical protein